MSGDLPVDSRAFQVRRCVRQFITGAPSPRVEVPAATERCRERFEEIAEEVRVLIDEWRETVAYTERLFDGRSRMDGVTLGSPSVS